MVTGGAVRTRHVFFLAGFDPKGASWYHALYRCQAQMQGRVTGSKYEIDARHRGPDGNAIWNIRATGAGHDVCTTYEFVRWDDLVRAHWPRSTWRLLAASWQTYCTILRSGQLTKVRRIAPRTLIPLALPALYWLAVPALATAVALGCTAAGLGAAATALAGAGAAAAMAWTAIRWEQRLNTTWLLRIYRFADLLARGAIPELDARLDALARRIANRTRDPEVDEVLLVGFSVGSILAVSALARTLGRQPEGNGKLGILTLGHCIPLLGLMPHATAFRQELLTLAAAEDLAWIDFSSVTDWGSFAQVDPIRSSVDPPRNASAAPRLASPRFHTLFAPASYRKLRRDKRRMHLQYLMAGEIAGEYDYFALTSGPTSLRSRLAAGSCA